MNLYPNRWIIGMLITLVGGVAGGTSAYTNLQRTVYQNERTVAIVAESIAELSNGVTIIREGLIAEGIISPK